MGAAPVAPTRPHAGRVVVWVVVGALATLVLVASLFLVQPLGIVYLVAYAGTGLVLAARRPHQAIAWLLVAIGVGLALGNVRIIGSPEAILAGTTSSVDAFTVWANGTGWSLAFVGLVGLALVFPGGSLPAGSARPPAIAWLALSGVAALLIDIAPVVNITPAASALGIDVPNPYAVLPGSPVWAVIPDPDLLFTLLFALFATSFVALLVRFRRSTGLVRLQYRWLVWAIVLVIAGTAVWAIATSTLAIDLPLLVSLPLLITYPCVPIAVAVAVLRYRLYDIDRIVSRTVGWALATATVVAAFVVAVLTLQVLLSGFTQGQALATAMSTLIAFALFRPVRERVQGLVDRRFDRPRIEAERTLARYGEQLGHEVDIDTIEATVLDTVASALRPATAGLWIRPLAARSGRGLET